MVKVEKKELENFLYYLEDKTENCYKKEVQQAIKDFLKNVKVVS